VGDQRLDRVVVQVGDGLADAAGVVAEEVDGQLEDVLLALPQRGGAQADDVEPVVQVLAEPPGADQRLEVLVGGRHDPDVDGDRLRAADALEGLPLQDAQQLGLDLEVDVADLVEEQRAAVGLLEPPDAVAVGAGEGPLDVAEQLALQQALRQGRAVDLDERAAGARAGGVDRLGQELLAGAALAPDQHGRAAGGDLAGQLQHLPHRLARALDPAEDLRLGGRRVGAAGGLAAVGGWWSRSWSWRIRIRRCCSAIFSTLSRSSWLRLSRVCWMPAERNARVATEPRAPRKTTSSSS
jgi:hypothetical protein